MEKRTQNILLIGAAGYGVYYYSQFEKFKALATYSVTGIKFDGVTSTGTDSQSYFTVVVSINNPSDFSITVDSMNVQASINDKPVGTSMAKNVKIMPMAITNISVQVMIDNADMISEIIDLSTNGGDIDVSAKLTFLFGLFSSQFNAKYTV